jgi:PKD repeat protein
VVADTTTTVDFALVPAPETVVFVDPPVATANPGESFTINVNVTDVEDLYSWGAKISWQLGLLTVTNAEEGPFLQAGGSTFFTWNPHAGYVDLACTFLGAVPGVSGSGGLASVTFEVMKAGNCTLDLYDTTLLNSSLVQISHQAFDGYFYTTYPVAQFTYSPNPLDNPGHPIEGEPITFDASTSYDPDGGVIDVYEWDFGDETSGLGQIVDHSYDSAGSYMVNLTVTDDEGETWSELLQILVLLHDISVEEVVVDPTEVVPGNLVEINATILNIGLVSETFNVTVYYDDTPIDTQTYMGLSPEENTTLTFIWDTSGVPPNEYTIKAYAYLVDAATLEARPDLETNLADNTLVDGTVTVTAPDIHDVAVTSVTAPAQAVQGDTVAIDVDVSNLGGFEETFDVEVTYDTTLIDSQSVTLASGASTTVSLSWDTTGVALGTYTITAEAILATDEVPANNIATTTIEITTVVTHDIAILDVVPSTLEVVIGDSVEIDVTIINEGTVEETFTVKVYADAELVDSTTQTLNAGAEETFSFSWTTNVTGTFLIEAEVPAVPGETDTTDNTLADGEVTVIPQQIDHPVEVGGVTFDVTTESNSTISDFTFDQAEKQLAFDVTGPEGTVGSCNVTIPKDLLGAPFTVLINGVELTYVMTENATHYFLYFTYNHSAHAIQIEATTVATPPIASFTYLPLSPSVGETVDFDASASYDPDGTIASYTWDFGDATTGSGMTTNHIYTSADTYTVTLTVTDNDGLSDTATQDITVTEVAAITAQVNIDPDTLNLESKGKTITCYIKLPKGYSARDIDISTVILDGVISAERGETDENVLMVKFNRAEVIQYINDVLHMTEGEVTLTITGSLADGTPFEGEDTIRVQTKGKNHLSVLNFAQLDPIQLLALLLWPLARALTRSRFG